MHQARGPSALADLRRVFCRRGAVVAVAGRPLSGTDRAGVGVFASVGGVAVAAIAAAIVIIKRKSRTSESHIVVKESEQPKPQSLDPESIFKAKQDLREDDKEIVNFLSANGGQAYESELRKKFLQPRTTMWRAVKRLERQGIIEIEKKDLQNIVRLKSSLEDSS